MRTLKTTPQLRLEPLDTYSYSPFDPGHVDYVFNLASPACPVDYHRLGIEGPRTILKLYLITVII